MKLEYFATGNANKLREFNQILETELKQVDLDLLEPQGVRVEDIVEVKAKDAFQQFGQPVLVEDTSLEFAAWGGLPGALIKWFLDSVGTVGIIKMMANETERQATAKTVIAYYDGHQVHTYVGTVDGRITNQLEGEQGFGWDGIFTPEGYDRTYAQMSAEEKNQISTRKLALDQLVQSL